MTTTTPIEIEGYVDITEAARLLDIHPQSARRLIKRGQLSAKLVFGKYLIEKAELERMKADGYDGVPGKRPVASVRDSTGQLPAFLDWIKRRHPEIDQWQPVTVHHNSWGGHRFAITVQRVDQEAQDD